MRKPDVLLRLEAAVEEHARLGRCGSMSEPSVVDCGPAGSPYR